MLAPAYPTKRLDRRNVLECGRHVYNKGDTMPIFDSEKFLTTPMFALNQLSVLSDVLSFLQFSERNIQQQKSIALDGVNEEVENSGIEEPDIFSYRRHVLDSINFRFDVALPMRVRYAALTAFTSTVEWSISTLTPSFEFPKRPEGRSDAIHRLFVFSERCEMPIEQQINCMEFLIWVRNSIMHNAGVLKGYRYEQHIRVAIAAYRPNFAISNWHYIGDTVEIKLGAIEPLVEAWVEIIREIYTTATKKNLLIFKAAS